MVVQAEASAATSDTAKVAAADALEVRIQKADRDQVVQEVQSLSARIQSRRAELLQQPELARLADAHQKAQADYRQKLTAHPDYVAAVQQHEADITRFDLQAVRVRELRGHYVNHRTPALAAEFPDVPHVGRVKNCVFCEEAYGHDQAGDPAVFRRQNEQYLQEATAYRELRKGALVWLRQEQELSARLRQTDADLDRLARAAAKSAAAVEQALAADPQLRQLTEQSERWRKRGLELRQPAAK
ncbi:MAG: hypothetical protein NTV49_06630 [Kiritimatiellaeota bacterium]|nr:hypothetical protein [Kiritimatiellota bacterium]